MPDEITRPIIGIEHRTAQEVFDIMCERFRGRLPSLPSDIDGLVEELEKRKDAAYEERNKVVAALTHLFPSGIKNTDIPGWSPDWHGCVYIDLPTGQVSWHFHDSQRHLFDGLAPYQGEWDGHDTEEKYRRLAALRARQAPMKGEPLKITYTNWRGETSQREIRPLYMWFGSTEWHPEPQWIITAKDLGKGVERDFALSGFSRQAPEGGGGGWRRQAAPVCRYLSHRTMTARFMVKDHQSSDIDSTGPVQTEEAPRCPRTRKESLSPTMITAPRFQLCPAGR